jgi:hypothetical protein
MAQYLEQLPAAPRPSERPRPAVLRRAPDLRSYFETAIGSGFLATASSSGTINVALYDRPLVVDDELVVFAMKHRLTHDNLRDNPHATYVFHEPGPRRGIRLYLEKVREELGGELLDKFRRRADWLSGAKEGEELKTLVYFRVTATLPLVAR